MRNIAIVLLAATALSAQIADLVVKNARVYTVNPKQPVATAIAVKGDRILAVGDDMAKYTSDSTKIIDAKGAALIPGLIDSHGHVADLGESLETLNLRGITSEREIVEKVRQAAKTAKQGEWIRGRAWDQNLWDKKEFPTAAGISEAAPNNPVYLTRVDGHAAWVNNKAIEMADINAATPDPAGGKIIREANGKPAGVLVDRGQALVARKIGESTAETIENRIKLALAECARLGLTTVHDAGASEAAVNAYHRLAANNAMAARVYVMIGGPGKLWDSYLAKGPEIGDFVTIRSIKLVSDGALGSRGAAMIDPYSDDRANRGLLITNRATIRTIAEQAIAKGFQVNTHAIGDRGNRTVLEAYGDVLKSANDKRFRVEHAQIVAPADFPLFKKYSVIASMQATHATSDMPWAETRIGKERLKGAYAWQTFLKLGVHLPNGSDFPVEEPNPMFGLYSAITRMKQDGTPANGWFPTQRLSRREALKSWTLEGAYAAFEENQKGSLEPGKLADFILLSDDIMTMPEANIWKTKVTMTILGGRIVYELK